VFINAGVVMGLLPPKGLTLPFLSYGGSSVIVLSILFSLIISLERKIEAREIYNSFSNFSK
jgi:cell division protein FtsW